MKQGLRWCGVAGLLVLVAGCVPSLQPLYTPDTIAFDPALVGAWCQTNKEDRWEFTKSGDDHYKLNHTDKEKHTAEFTGYLVKVKDQRFLDLYPEDSDAKLNDLFAMYLVAAHTFLWVPKSGATLELAMMSPDAVKKLLAEKPNAVKHEKVKDGILLTAAPKELQAFLAASDLTELYGEPIKLVKAPAKKD
jgi:hypothetical protein